MKSLSPQPPAREVAIDNADHGSVAFSALSNVSTPRKSPPNNRAHNYNKSCNATVDNDNNDGTSTRDNLLTLGDRSLGVMSSVSSGTNASQQLCRQGYFSGGESKDDSNPNEEWEWDLREEGADDVFIGNHEEENVLNMIEALIGEEEVKFEQELAKDETSPPPEKTWEEYRDKQQCQDTVQRVKNHGRGLP